MASHNDSINVYTPCYESIGIYTFGVNVFSTQSEIDDETKLLVHADGDLSDSHHDLTYNNGVKFDYVSTPVGDGALKGNRTATNDGAYIFIPDSEDFNFGDGDFCIEAWVKPNAIENGIMFVNQSDYKSGANYNYSFLLRTDSSDNTLAFTYSSDGVNSTTINSSNALSNDTWQHIVVSRNVSSLYLFINGSLEETHNIGSTTLYNSSHNLSILGKNVTDSGPVWGTDNGYMADVRITKGKARYTSAFTPPTTRLTADANTVLLISGQGDFGTTGHSITTYNGIKESNDQYKFGNGALYFDGSNDYLTVPDHADWNFGSGDFTIDCWVYLNSLGSTGRVICGQSVDSDNRWYLAWIDNSNIWRLYVRSGGSEILRVEASDSPSINTWYHIAVVRDGNTFKIFRDGTDKTSSGGTDSDAFVDFTAELTVGRGNTGAINYHDGFIDELRISKGIARWTSNFTPPTLAYETGNPEGISTYTNGYESISIYTFGVNLFATRVANWAYFDGSESGHSGTVGYSLPLSVDDNYKLTYDGSGSQWIILKSYDSIISGDGFYSGSDYVLNGNGEEAIFLDTTSYCQVASDNVPYSLYYKEGEDPAGISIYTNGHESINTYTSGHVAINIYTLGPSGFNESINTYINGYESINLYTSGVLEFNDSIDIYCNCY